MYEKLLLKKKSLNFPKSICIQEKTSSDSTFNAQNILIRCTILKTIKDNDREISLTILGENHLTIEHKNSKNPQNLLPWKKIAISQRGFVSSPDFRLLGAEENVPLTILELFTESLIASSLTIIYLIRTQYCENICRQGNNVRETRVYSVNSNSTWKISFVSIIRNE